MNKVPPQERGSLFNDRFVTLPVFIILLAPEKEGQAAQMKDSPAPPIPSFLLCLYKQVRAIVSTAERKQSTSSSVL
jgi:hypothetical protein